MSEHRAKDPLLRALSSPQTLTELSEVGWGDLLGLARETGLLSRLGCLLAERGILDQIPEKARLQLAEARSPVAMNQAEIRFEVRQVARALAKLDIPIILLKGAAYLLADLPPARARFAGDIDIMVEKEHLDLVEQTLRLAGWQMANMTDYDEAYFRKWMHELPPRWHPARLVAVDVHHTIIPITSRYKPDTKALFASAVPLGNRRLKVLCPADMVLHGAAHLFNEEFILGLRNLTDLQDLLEYFAKTEGFWDDLLDRSNLHGLQRVLYYLLRYTRRVFPINIPEYVDENLRSHAPNVILRSIMDGIVMSGLQPAILGKSQPGRAIGLLLLQIHYHWLNMPPLLLARHLTTKALYRWRNRGRPALAGAQTKPN